MNEFLARVKACADDGKKIPSIVTKHLNELARIESLLKVQPNNEFANSRKSRLFSYLNDEISALENKEVRNTSSVKVGENVLDNEQLARKANRHVGLVNELARIREDMTRRIKEVESSLESVKDSIPMSQREEYTKLVNLLAQSGITLE